MELTLRPSSDAARHARRWATAQLPTGVALYRRQLLELLLTELVTNAVKYGHDPDVIRITMHLNGADVRVTVSDANPSVLPVARNAPPADEGGRGVMLVDQLADDWGFMTDHHSKVVWFRLSLAERVGEHEHPAVAHRAEGDPTPHLRNDW